MKQVYASVITIGDELLIGQTIDTNSAYIAQELNKIGIWVRRRVAVGDQPEDIQRALDDEKKQATVIIITGGLGPTSDDITKPLLCRYFGAQLVENEQVLLHIKYLFEHVYRRPGPLLDVNRKQAAVPDNCIVLMNERGTAPGMMWDLTNAGNGSGTGNIFISLPGVPFEMKGLMEKEVIPRLSKSILAPVIIHQTLLTVGAGESMIAEHIKSWEQKLPPYAKLAYLPHYGMVRIRLTITGDDKNALEEEIELLFAQLKTLVRDWLVIDEDLTLQQAVAKLLKERKQTAGTAESCTGGYIAHLLSRDPGSSSNYKGSIISYDNEVKTKVLGVKKKTLETVGAVSKETVTQMAEGALEQLGSDYVVVTSGIMGPDGGSEHKPVGLVWIAVGSKKGIKAKEFNFRFDRSRNIEQTAITALEMLRREILNS
jgi:nicotinamide-nucleotide amidase